MKTASDPRHQRRISQLKFLFSFDFNKKQKIDPAVSEIIKNQDTIDKTIQEAASLRPLDQINKIDLAILRLSVFELLLLKDAPIKVIVDEAVELAKEYGSESSPSFVNGVLGKVIENKKI
jgi:transcription antitermination protein NusB